MEARQFLTPFLVVDGSQLAFVGPIEPGREAETFATLLTFTTFAEKSDSVIDEAYTLACASTGTSSRLDENRWYDIAREYYEEYLEQLNTASPAELQSHLDWLDLHFFARHPGYEGARMMNSRLLRNHPARGHDARTIQAPHQGSVFLKQAITFACANYNLDIRSRHPYCIN